MRVQTWTLAAACAAVMTLTAGRALAQAPGGQVKPAAVVNGEPISLAEVDLISRAGPTAVQLTEGKLRETRLAAVGMLIDDLLLKQFLRQSGPRVNPADVEKEFADLVEGQKKAGKTLQDFLKENSLTEAQLRANIVSDLQLREYIRARVTDDQVKHFYDENRDYFDKVTVRVSHIVLRLAPDAPPQERQQARDKLLALRQEIVSGKLDFAEAARKYSQCSSAPKGGDLEGFFPRKYVMEENFAKAAFALQVGQVSDVVQTEYGLHLIKVTARNPGEPSDFAKIKEGVRDCCTYDLKQSLLEQLRKTAKVEVTLP
jgi:peptidyl-prolyl cis-trans isomerase C